MADHSVLSTAGRTPSAQMDADLAHFTHRRRDAPCAAGSSSQRLNAFGTWFHSFWLTLPTRQDRVTQETLPKILDHLHRAVRLAQELGERAIGVIRSGSVRYASDIR